MNLDYNEVLLESIQTLIDASLQRIVMDRNVVCTVVDNTDRDEGHYKVTQDGNVIYDAYSESTSYARDEQVLVLFPKDDTQKRTIISRYITNTDEKPLAYVSSKEKLVQIGENLVKSSASYKLTANGETDLVSVVLANNCESQVSDTIYLAADFQTIGFDTLQQLNMRSGNYGLRVMAYYDSNKVGEWVLDSSMMFGNPYAFEVPFRQEIALHYGDLIFDSLDLELYQLNNFTYFDGTAVQDYEPIAATEGAYMDNLIVSNIEMFLGCNLEATADNTVKIYTNDSNIYDREGIGPGDKKNISLIFYNKDENDKYIGFEANSEFNLEAAKKARAKVSKIVESKKEDSDEIKYRYYLEGVSGSCLSEDGKLKFTDNNEIIEVGDVVYYTTIKDNNNYTTTIKIYTTKPENKLSYGIEWTAHNKNGVMGIVPGTGADAKTITLTCPDTLTKTQVYATVYCNGASYKSNTLEFINQQDINRNSLALQNLEVSIKHGENSQEAYALYDGLTNMLITPGEAVRRRVLEFGWTAAEGYAVEKSFWNGAKIRWSMPKTGTMFKPTKEWKSDETETSYYYESTIQVSDKGEFSGHTCSYNINDYYLMGLRNNDITCTVTVPLEGGVTEGSITGKITMGFSTFGSSGTDYTIVFSESSTQVSAQVVDKDNQLINDAKIEMRIGPWTTFSEKSTINKPTGDQAYTKYNLVEAKALVKHEEYEDKIWIHGCYPIVMSTSKKYSLAAPLSIIYDSTGTNPTYYKGKIQLIDEDGAVQPLDSCNVRYYDIKGDEVRSPTDRSTGTEGLPYFDDNNTFVVPKTKIQSPTVAEVAYYVGLQIHIGGDTGSNVTAPIYIDTNRFESSLLNNWDGSMVTDKDGNYILTAMIGAGHKNSDNSYTGVVMGDYGELDSNNSIQDKKTGLFGFNAGNRVFELNTEGKLILGASGHGQITFDGNSGIIQSGNYASNSSGMKIDLQSGHIDAYNFTLTSAGINLNSNPKSQENYFLIGDLEDSYLKYTKEGKLDIVASKFSLSTGSLINENLLKNASLYTKDNPRTYTSNGTTVWDYTNMTATVAQGQEYTFSFEKSADFDKGFIMLYKTKDDDGYAENEDIAKSFTTSPFTFTVPSGYIFARVRFDAKKDGKTYKAWNCKLEKGDQATPWVSDLNFDKNQGIFLENGNLRINANHITTGVLQSNNYSTSNKTGMKITLSSGAIGTGSGNFSVDENGNIQAKSGKIGGFTVKTNGIFGALSGTTHDVNGKQYYYGIGFDPSSIGNSNNAVLAIGNMEGLESNSAWPASFRVTGDGKLYATGAVISGDVTASSLSATATISAGRITAGTLSANISLGNSGQITFGNFKITNTGISTTGGRSLLYTSSGFSMLQIDSFYVNTPGQGARFAVDYDGVYVNKPLFLYFGSQREVCKDEKGYLYVQ